MFTHNLVTPVKLKQTNINGKRYYILPDGVTKLKSVTTVLSEKKDNTTLFEWKKRVGPAEAKKISGIATRRGTSVHKMTERFLLNEENAYGSNPMPDDIQSFSLIKETLERHVDNIRGIELKLYSTALGAAGTTDLVADYDKIPSIIDFKTSKKKKREDWIEEYFLQETAYSMMFFGLYGEVIPQIVTIITVDNEPQPQIFVRDPKKYMKRAIEIFTK